MEPIEIYIKDATGEELIYDVRPTGRISIAVDDDACE